MTNLIDGYERTLITIRDERNELRKQKKKLAYIIAFLLISGGFGTGYLIAVNIEQDQTIKMFLNSSDVPQTLKNKVINKNER